MNYIAIIICSCVGFVLGFVICNSIRWRKMNNAIHEMDNISRGLRKAAKRVKK